MLKTLDRILEAVRAAAPHADVQSRGGQYYAICPADEQSAADAVIAAFDDSPEAQAAWDLARSRTDAKSQAAAGNGVSYLVIRAVFATMLDQINTLRTKAGLATVTAEQALAAVQAKIDALS